MSLKNSCSGNIAGLNCFVAGAVALAIWGFPDFEFLASFGTARAPDGKRYRTCTEAIEAGYAP